MKKPFCRYVTAIDIGTTKICVLIAAVDLAGRMDIVGMGQYPSYGLKKGVVTNIAKTVASIQEALKEAESMAGIEVEAALVGISGAHIRSMNSTGVVAIKGKEVSQEDIDRVIDAAGAIPIPDDQEILHVIPQYFRVDGQERVMDSLGMYGIRLEAEVHVVTGAVASAKNIIKACELAGVKVSDIVLEQIASACAVLTPSEQAMGIGMLDIGGGTSDFAVYHDGAIRHSKVIPIAGNLFTNDISLGMGIPFGEAEELKKQYARIGYHPQSIPTDRYVDISLGYDGGIKTVDIGVLSEIATCRAEELLDLFIEELLIFKLQHIMAAGLVMTGGGASLSGLKDFFEQRIAMPVRIGIPGVYNHQHVKEIPDILKHPKYATGYGLLLYALNDQYKSSCMMADQMMIIRLASKMKSWICNFF